MRTEKSSEVTNWTSAPTKIPLRASAELRSPQSVKSTLIATYDVNTINLCCLGRRGIMSTEGPSPPHETNFKICRLTDRFCFATSVPYFENVLPTLLGLSLSLVWGDRQTTRQGPTGRDRKKWWCVTHFAPSGESHRETRTWESQRQRRGRQIFLGHSE
jgi:hypothetical protein